METNTGLNLTFTGTALQHKEYENSKMLTTYWAFESHHPDDLPLLIRPPVQIIPKYEIGYFGESGHVLLYDDPWQGAGTEFVNVPKKAYFAILAALAIPDPERKGSNQPSLNPSYWVAQGLK